jgi:hypothetical protein
MRQPSIQLLREIFELRDDGCLYWRVQRRGMNKPSIGLPAGRRHSEGYRTVSVNGKFYFEHRVIFAMTHGRWPVGEIDHINRNRSDSRPENLREATRGQNGFNKPVRKDSKSGIKGIRWHKVCQKWQAKISVSGRDIYLGVHDDLEFAKFVYQCAAEKYHGQFVPGQS